MSKLYNVGAYIRLSVEDAVTDSDSVENQSEMLAQFVNHMPGWILHKRYIDNGYSGSNFDRPSFLEMIADVRSGLVNLVIVKDLSRFGRHYLEVGRYLEEELPALGCRFVALADGVDTEDGLNDIVPFINALNDQHIKGISNRIRAVMAAKARDGQKIAGPAPYGYNRDPADHTRLVEDPYSAGVVRRIFEMRSNSMGYPSIVKALNSEQILPPTLYYRKKQGLDSSHIKTRQWIVSTVAMILKRELYLGTAVQLVKKVVSYRNSREIKRPLEDQVRVENAFPALIDRETWERVQVVNQQARAKSSSRRKPRKSLFSGLLVCADCGVTMLYCNSPKTYPSGVHVEYANYICRTFQATGAVSCSKHTIYEADLKKVLLSQIQQLATEIGLDEEGMRRSLADRLIGQEMRSQAEVEKEAHLLNQQIHKLTVHMAKLYEDRIAGELSEKSFLDRMAKRESERQQKEHRIHLLNQSDQQRSAKLSEIQCWMDTVRMKASFDDVNRDFLDALVERIEIGEREVVDGKKRQDIRIYYRFVGVM